jgi:hypothetical protein
MEAIGALKNSIEHLLDYLKEKTQYHLPLFIFIDELDRCRPDYAIRLLEGIKHLFDAKNVCFVVSTNMTQLSESVKAVYGSGFEAYRYLKRFFAFEYMLPEPDYDAFALMLVKDSFLATTNLEICSGLQEENTRGSVEIMAANFAIIAKAFNMDLRSQQQCFRSAEAAISALPDSEPFYCFYMFFWAGLLHYSRENFEWFIGNPDDWSILEKQDSHFTNASIRYYAYRETANLYTEKVVRETSVKVVLELYSKMAHKKIGEILKIRDMEQQYPSVLRFFIREHLPRNLSEQDKDSFPSLKKYPQTLRMAGQIK